MKKLKSLLQSKFFYYCIVFFIILYVIIFTIVLKYSSNIKGEEFEGIIISEKYNEGYYTFIIKGQEKIIGYYTNYTNNKKNYLGKKVKIVFSEKELLNSTIPNTYNYKKYLYYNRIYKTVNIIDIKIIGEENIFYKIKNDIISRINSYDNIIKPYLNIFIMGNKSLLDKEIYTNYTNLGVSHLFSLSGMHLSLIIYILRNILKKVKHKNIFIIIILALFLFITGYSPSLERSIVFYVLSSILEKLEITISNIKKLLLTGVIIIIINPFIVYNIAFQYSFIVTMGIFMFYQDSHNYFISIIKISAIAIIVSLPITINMNYELNILSIIFNVFYIPFISFMLFPTCLIVIIIKFLSPVAIILVQILEKISFVFNKVSITITVPKMNFIIIILFYIILMFIYKYKRKNLLLLLILPILINYGITKYRYNNNVLFFDVNQGDSALIIYKYNTCLIDTGGINYAKSHISDNIIIYLKSIGIYRLNHLILTHGDYDHMGEAINLVENFKVEKVIFNCGEYNNLESELIKVLDKKRIPYYSCIKELNVDNNKLYFLQTKEYDNENDNSNVIYTEIDGYKFMLMGDASITTEKEILNKYNISNIDVLKVGHHGSKTSSGEDFINEMNPKYSIISVGKNNRYGHPNKEVLNNLNKSKIYRTDEDGSIMFRIKNDKLQIETCSP